MKDYKVGLITGIIMTLSCMLFISAQSSFQQLSLGELIVNKMTVKNEKGETMCTIGGNDSGILTLYKNSEPFAIIDAEGGQSASLSLYYTNEQSSVQSRIADGKFQSYYTNGTMATMLGIDDFSGGVMSIKDQKDSMACLITSAGELSLFRSTDKGQFSSNILGNGTASFINSEDSSGVYLGVNSPETGGAIHFKNNYGKITANIGTNLERDGLISIMDRYGSISWGKTGKMSNSEGKE